MLNQKLRSACLKIECTVTDLKSHWSRLSCPQFFVNISHGSFYNFLLRLFYKWGYRIFCRKRWMMNNGGKSLALSIPCEQTKLHSFWVMQDLLSQRRSLKVSSLRIKDLSKKSQRLWCLNFVRSVLSLYRTWETDFSSWHRQKRYTFVKLAFVQLIYIN